MITTTAEVLVRLAVSLALGGLIGVERQYHEKPAGFATNTLICLGSTVFALLSILSAQAYGGDPARIAAQIVTGVGFLGAGSILREGNKISGLTTAAGIWLVAAVGMAVGYGEFAIAFTATVFALFLQLFLRKFIERMDALKEFEIITVKCEPDWKVVDRINAILSSKKADILKKSFFKEDGFFVIKMETNMSSAVLDETLKELADIKEIRCLKK